MWNNDIRTINPRFHFSFTLSGLTCNIQQTRWLVLQKAHRHPVSRYRSLREYQISKSKYQINFKYQTLNKKTFCHLIFSIGLIFELWYLIFCINIPYRTLVRYRAPIHCKHMVSDTISSPLSGYFSPFPHGTCSLSIIKSI